MPRQLKVYRTPIGFHDAYVAAPSQKAAMEAWGSGKDLFTRGEAEVVTDPALTAEPLASPGVVIKRLRGTEAEQIAALGPARKSAPGKKAAPRPEKPRPPRPSRGDLEAAEEALAAARKRHQAELAELAEREAALERERRALQKAQADEAARLTRAEEKARKDYEAAMRRWRG